MRQLLLTLLLYAPATSTTDVTCTLHYDSTTKKILIHSDEVRLGLNTLQWRYLWNPQEDTFYVVNAVDIPTRTLHVQKTEHPIGPVPLIPIRTIL